MNHLFLVEQDIERLRGRYVCKAVVAADSPDEALGILEEHVKGLNDFDQKHGGGGETFFDRRRAKAVNIGCMTPLGAEVICLETGEDWDE